MAPDSSPAARASGSVDPIWQSIRSAVESEARREPLLADFLRAVVLDHERLEDALGFHLAEKLATRNLPAEPFRGLWREAMSARASIGEALRADLVAIRERDPACTTYWVPLLYFKGFHAIQTHRVANWLWQDGRFAMALHLQNRVSELFGVDIHPAARLGRGLFIDHATSVVMGETCVVEDDVSMLHEVTLGGTGKEQGDRHPKVRRGVLICAGAKVLGNVEVGEGAKVAAGSVVLSDVPAHCTVAGVPAVVVGTPDVEQPALEMDARITRDR
jgi:serine O-acetyltransferase